MSEVQRQEANKSMMILLVAGALCVLFGFFMYNHRFGFAELLLGAHSLFGLAFTGVDAMKVLAVAIVSTIVVLMGIVIAVAGLMVPSKPAAGRATATSSHR